MTNPKPLNLESIIEPEWLAWFALSPQERMVKSGEMWEIYKAYGRTLAPEPDTQSPFFDSEEWSTLFANRGTSLRIIRRS